MRRLVPVFVGLVTASMASVPVAVASTGRAAPIAIRLSPRAASRAALVHSYRVPSSGGSVTLTAVVRATGVCRWVRLTPGAGVSSTFETGFLPCSPTMHRTVRVAANRSGVVRSTTIGLQVLASTPRPQLEVAYARLLVTARGRAAAGSSGAGGPTSGSTSVATTTLGKGPTTTGAAATSTSVPRQTTTTAPRPTTTQPPGAGSGSGSFSPVHTTRWAGYFESVGAVTSASGTWTVPKLTCPASGTTASSTWIGVGGLDGSVLFQAGMFDNCVGGIEEHGAFVETYPGGIGNFSLAMAPGDVVNVVLAPATGGNWTARVTNRTTGKSEVGTGAYSGGGDVEWFTEAYATPTYPLSHFGSEQLSSFTVNGAAARIPESNVWEIPGVAIPSDPATGVYRLTTP